MARQKKNRIINQPPLYSKFKPAGKRSQDLDTVNLSLDEYEAIRLADYQNLNHHQAAVEMEISRPTFSRLIESARQKIATFIIEGQNLCISGGNIHFRGNLIKCRNCERMFEIDFNTNLETCPACGSKDLIDIAGSHGHGRCCRGRGGRNVK